MGNEMNYTLCPIPEIRLIWYDNAFKLSYFIVPKPSVIVGDWKSGMIGPIHKNRLWQYLKIILTSINYRSNMRFLYMTNLNISSNGIRISLMWKYIYTFSNLTTDPCWQDTRLQCGSHDKSLQWRHNGHDRVSNHQPHDCLLNRIFRRRSKKTSKLRVTGLWAGNSPGTGEFPAQMASNAENVSIWWRHHEWRKDHSLLLTDNLT